MQRYLEKNDFENKNIVIFGTGKLGEEWYKELKKIGLDVDYFGDNNKTKWNSFFFDKKILSLSELYKLNRETTIIIIASQAYETVFEQLRIANFETYIGCYENQMIEQCDFLLGEFNANELLPIISSFVKPVFS